MISRFCKFPLRITQRVSNRNVARLCLRHFCSKEEPSSQVPVKQSKDAPEKAEQSQVPDLRNKLMKHIPEKQKPKFDPYKKAGLPREYWRLIGVCICFASGIGIYTWLKPNEMQAETRDRIMHFFAKMNADDDVIVTYTGLMYKILRKGPMEDDDKGHPHANSDTALVNYRGRFMDGTIFDSTFDAAPCAFNIPDILEGLAEGIPLMKSGDLYEFYIPDHLAYGSRGSKMIPPFEPLIFEIELLDFWETPQTDNVYVAIVQHGVVRLPGS